MKLEKGEIRIDYRTEDGEIDADLDLALEIVLAGHGYRRWASSYDVNLTSDIRNLAFTKRGKEEK